MNDIYKVLLSRVHDYNPYVYKVYYLKKYYQTTTTFCNWNINTTNNNNINMK